MRQFKIDNFGVGVSVPVGRAWERSSLPPSPPPPSPPFPSSLPHAFPSSLPDHRPAPVPASAISPTMKIHQRRLFHSSTNCSSDFRLQVSWGPSLRLPLNPANLTTIWFNGLSQLGPDYAQRPKPQDGR